MYAIRSYYAFPLFLLVVATIPAKPPNVAISTSYIVGLVLASNSEYSVRIGVIVKYRKEVIKEAETAYPRFFNERLNSTKSYVAILKPTPVIGPINGEINIAPIITAVEFIFNPTLATNMAKIRIHAFVPLNSTPLLIVITSYSIHYTKLYDRIQRFSECFLFVHSYFFLRWIWDNSTHRSLGQCSNYDRGLRGLYFNRYDYRFALRKIFNAKEQNSLLQKHHSHKA